MYPRTRHSLAVGLLAAVLAAAPAVPCRAGDWRYYTTGQGLPNDTVRDLVEAPDGSVWAATPAGLARFSGGSWAWIANVAENFHVLAIDGAGRVWAGGTDGSAGVLRLFAADGSSISPLPAGWEERIDGDIRALTRDGAEEMWILTDRFVRKWRRGAVIFSPEILAFDNSQNYFAVAIDARGRAWFGSSSGLWRFENGAPVAVGPVVAGGSVRQNSVVTLTALPDAAMLVGTLEGELWRDDGSARVLVTLPPNPTSSSILRAFLDRSGSLWISREAVYRLRSAVVQPDPSAWPLEQFDATNGLQGEPIHAFLDVFAGRATEMWFGGDGGISVLETQRWELFDSSNGLLGDRAGRCAYLSSCNHMARLATNQVTGELWAGAVEGLSRFRGEADWTGWVTALAAGPPDPILSNRTRSILCDDDGSVWVGSGQEQYPGGPLSGGLQVLPAGADRDEWMILGQAAAQPRWLVADLSRDSQGALWMASQDGVWRMEVTGPDTTYTHFDAADGAPTAPLNSIASEGGFVVAAAATGELSVYAQAKASWTAWSLQDLLAGGANISIRRVLLRDGVVYAATSAGLVVADVTAPDLVGARVLSGLDGFANDLRDLAIDAGGFLLVASNVGLLRTDLDLTRWRRLAESDGLASGDLAAVAVRGDEIWVGSNGSGLMRHVFVAPDTAFDRAPEEVVGTRDLLSMQVHASDPDSPALSAQFQWRVDAGPWSSPAPDRNIAFVPSELGLAHGSHRVHVRAVDTEFNVEPVPADASFELDLVPPVAQIRMPRQGDSVSGSVAVTGTADDVRFADYRVVVRPRDLAGATETELLPWSAIAVDDGTLATWDTASGAFTDGWYQLEVSVRDIIDVVGTSQIEVLVDNEFPFVEESSPRVLRETVGGVVYDVTGQARVTVPPFALRRDQEIRLDATGVLEFELSAEQTSFDKPVVLRIEPGAPAAEDAAIYMDEDGVWKRLGGTAADGAWDVAVHRPGRFALRADAGEPTAGGKLSALSANPRLLHSKSAGVDRMAISFRLGSAASIHASIYSRNGRPRRILADGMSLDAGTQVLYWDGRDEDGDFVPPSLYIVCVEAGGERLTQVISVGRSR
jgi:ligand-binding sensor domain-containing protein